VTASHSPTSADRTELEAAYRELQQAHQETRRELALVRQCLNALVDSDEPYALADLPAALATQYGPDTPDREARLPAHRLWLAIQADDNTQLGATHRRAAILFGQFLTTATTETPTRVDTSGQTYSLTSGKAQEALVEADALTAVATSSRSTVTARSLRALQRLTQPGECTCETIDDCTHGVLTFRAGRPHAVATPKAQFREAIEAIGQGNTADADTTSTHESHQ
jgi:hypothetical protein